MLFALRLSLPPTAISYFVDRKPHKIHRMKHYVWRNEEDVPYLHLKADEIAFEGAARRHHIYQYIPGMSGYMYVKAERVIAHSTCPTDGGLLDEESGSRQHFDCVRRVSKAPPHHTVNVTAG